FFFFQAEDGIRDRNVTGVQTCALPIFIVSEANINETHPNAKEYQYVKVHVEKHEGDKCNRCWMHANSVGENEKHPELCSRCAERSEERRVGKECRYRCAQKYNKEREVS